MVNGPYERKAAGKFRLYLNSIGEMNGIILECPRWVERFRPKMEEISHLSNYLDER